MPENSIQNVTEIKAEILVEGVGEGEVIATDIPLSFWGGINPETGMIIDKYHPLSNQSIKSKVFVLPGGRGSSSGSGVLLEMIHSKCAPTAIILREKDEIITLGGIVAEKVFSEEIPIVRLTDEDFTKAIKSTYVKIDRDGKVILKSGVQIDE